MILTTGIIESLERCKACWGTGWLGTCGIYNLLCENCEGTGLDWIQRGCMMNLVHS